MADLRRCEAEVLAAHHRIKPYVRHTPLEPSYVLSALTGARVFLKLESEQVTGAFKVRGAVNKVTLCRRQTPNSEDIPHFYAASTGNHALACIYAAEKLRAKGTFFVPSSISPAKAEALRMRGADLRVCGPDCAEAEATARATAEKDGVTYVSPYNDMDVVYGQGTIGVEILEDCPDVDVVLVPVGGGGLIGGIAAYIKSIKPWVQVIGCQPMMSKVMYESVRAGHVVFEESGDTLSDGTAGGIEDNSVTFELCRSYVDSWKLVSEDRIAEAIYQTLKDQHKVVEGAAGCSIGAVMDSGEELRGKTVVVVVCGSSIGMDTLQTIINKHNT